MRKVHNLIIVFLLLTLVSCYENQDGCIDVNASNFDFEADQDCCPEVTAEACCCEYPDLKLSLKHQYGENNLSSSQTYINKLGQPFIIEGVNLLFSKISVFDSARIGVTNRLNVTTKSGEDLDIVDDIRLFTTRSFSVTAGSFPRPGLYDTLYFQLGVDPLLSTIDGDQFGINHVLHSTSVLRDSISQELFAGEVMLVTDTTTMVVDTFSIPSSLLEEFVLPLPTPVEKLAGEDITINLGINYEIWFADLDFSIDGEEEIIAKIISSIPLSISNL